MSVRKSLVVAFLENYVLTALGLVSSIVIARVLTPGEIGLFSVGATLVSLAHIVRDFGVGTYVIQEKELTRDRLRAAFTVTIALGWFLAAILAATSGLVASFYGEPRIRDVVLILAGNFVLLPFGSVRIAYLRRQMRFMPVFWVRTLSALTQMVVTVILVMCGYSYLSLAWGAFAGILANVVLAGLLGPKDMPLLPGLREVRRVVGFGSMASSAIVVAEIGNAAPDLVIGKLDSMASVALFGRAVGLVDLFNRFVGSAVGSVTLPYFADANRKGDSMRGVYVHTTALMTGVAWPFIGLLGLTADSVLVLLFGEEWLPSAPLARWLCISAAIQSAYAMAGALFVVRGDMRRYARFQIVCQAVKIALLGVTAPFGLVAVSIGMVSAMVVAAWLTSRELRRISGITIGDQFAAMRGSTVLASAAMVPAGLMTVGHSGPGSWWWLIATGSVALASWLAAVIVIRHAIYREAMGVFAGLIARFRAPRGDVNPHGADDRNDEVKEKV